MPECIEVAWTADCLNKLILGYKFLTPDPENNQIVSKVFSHGKQLFIQFKTFTINIHFGLSGYLSTIPNLPYCRYKIRFIKDNSDVYLYYYDKLNFGNVKYLYDKKELKDKLSKLGLNVMEPKEFTYQNFTSVIQGKRSSISKFLLEQKYMSGIGNYLKSEILYHAKINPYTPVNQLSNNDIERLYNAIKYIIYNSYLKGFTNQHIKEYNQIKENFGFTSIPLTLTSTDLNIENPQPYTFEVYERQTDSKGNIVIKEDIDGRVTYYINQ